MQSNPFGKSSTDVIPGARKAESPRTLSQCQPELLDGARQSIGSTTMFKDPAQVQQWVATSAKAPMSFPESPCGPLPTSGDAGLFDDVPRVCSSLQGSHGLPFDVPISFTPSPGLCDADFSPEALAANIYSTLQGESGYSEDGTNSGDLSYEVPGSADMVYTTSNHSTALVDDFFSHDSKVKRFGPPLPTGSMSQGTFSTSTAWSSPSSTFLEPSLSSSYSQASLFPCLESSPTTLAASEDSNSNFSYHDEGLLPASMAEYTVPGQFAFCQNDGVQYDMTSTIRPSDGFPRPPLSDLTFWPPCGQPSDILIPDVQLDVYMSRRPSGDHDNSSARRNELYHVGPQEDGLYHCPFEATEGCKHKPEKLKCNYDKHLDSHLKPYRCKAPACISVPFSSTACLLRHEREAHGMHGHGDRPFMCSYADCDRSLPGNGFPRRWNLMDHMKRVHDHHAPASNGRSSPGVSDNGKSGRKRRTSTSSQQSSSRVSKSSAKNVLAAKQKQAIQKQVLDQSGALRRAFE